MRWLTVFLILGVLANNALILQALKRQGLEETHSKKVSLLRTTSRFMIVLLVLAVVLNLLRPSGAEQGGLDDAEAACAALMGSELHPETSPEAREAFLKAMEAVCGPQ